MKTIERDFAPGSDTRTAGTAPSIFKPTDKKSPVLFGYAVVWGTSYSMGNRFMEEISRTAFKNTDFSEAACLWNHNWDNLLGRVKSGTLKFGTDEKGLWYQCVLPKGPRGQDMAESIQRGDCYQSSWAFTLPEKDADEWSREAKTGRPYRLITNVKEVFDFSPVTFPANPAASVSLLSLKSTEALERFEEAEDERKFIQATEIMRREEQSLAVKKTTAWQHSESDNFDADFERARLIMQADALLPRIR